MRNMTPRLAWTDDKVDSAVKISAYRKAREIAGCGDADDTDDILLDGVRRLVRSTYGADVTKDEALIIIREGLITII